jgi:hypothetical protein
MAYLTIVALVLSPLSLFAENNAQSLKDSLEKIPEDDYNRKYEVICAAIATDARIIE